MFKRGTGHGEATPGQEEGGKRTSIDCEQDHWNHQGNPTLIGAQNPSPPDNDAVGDNILRSKFKGTGQPTGDSRRRCEYEAGTL
jgi:hypothetical protein